MRCQFCGWDNPQGKETCEKCNKPLIGNVSTESQSSYGQDYKDRTTDRRISGEFNPKATVRESSLTGNVNKEETQECPKCGYPLENGECSACGYKVGEQEQPVHCHAAADVRKTVRPSRKADAKKTGFNLVPISERTGKPEGNELHYEGYEIILNRDNTDPKNDTITSQEQACITFEDGKWCIEDKSEYNTTFVQAAHKIELQEGDLILLGNQLYRFE